MSELNFHNNSESDKSIHTHTHTHTHTKTLPIIQKFVGVYKLWHEFRNHFPKKSRYTLGAKIENAFLEIIELLFIAGYLQKQQKLPYLQKASIKLDLLKFFLQISWELKALDNKKYIVISEPLNEIGKMLGGWIGNIKKETPLFPRKNGEQRE